LEQFGESIIEITLKLKIIGLDLTQSMFFTRFPSREFIRENLVFRRMRLEKLVFKRMHLGKSVFGRICLGRYFSRKLAFEKRFSDKCFQKMHFRSRLVGYGFQEEL